MNELNDPKAIEERRREMFLQVALDLARIEDGDEPIRKLANAARSLTGGETSCRVLLVNENEELFRCIDALPTRPSSSVVEASAYPELRKILTEKQKKRFLPGENSWVVGFATADQAQDLHCVCFVPIVDEAVVGIIECKCYQPSCALRDDQVASLDELARCSARSVARIRRYEIDQRRLRLFTSLNDHVLALHHERDEAKVRAAVPRMAARLLDWDIAALYQNQQRSEQLRLCGKHPDSLNAGSLLRYDQSVLGDVASHQHTRYENSKLEHDAAFEVDPPRKVIALPLCLLHGGLDSVLYVGDRSGLQLFPITDREVLERFAELVVVVLGNLAPHGHRLRVLNLLREVSDSLQEAHELEVKLHIALTAVTAGYGLGFNRAQIFLVDSRRTTLVGRMGIGHFDLHSQESDWSRGGHQNFGTYREFIGRVDLESLRRATPVGAWVTGLVLPLTAKDAGAFNEVVAHGRERIITGVSMAELPEAYAEKLHPVSVVVLMPIKVRGEVIGVLAADNPFTTAAITEEDIDWLAAYVSTLSRAIDKHRLLANTQRGEEALGALFKASNGLRAEDDAHDTLRHILNASLAATGATLAAFLRLDGTSVVLGLESQGSRCPIPQTLVDEISSAVVGKGGIHEVESSVCLPFSVEGRRIGCLWLHFPAERRFLPVELSAFQLYVNQAAGVYEASLRMAEVLQLQEAANVMSRAAGMASAADEIVAAAKKISGADIIVLWPFDLARAAADDLASGFLPEYLRFVGMNAEDLPPPRPDASSVKILKEGYVAAANLRLFYEKIGAKVPGGLERKNAKSFEGIALHNGQEQVGVLMLTYCSPRTFDAADERKLTAFAAYAALSLTRGRLYDQDRRARNALGEVARFMVLGQGQGQRESAEPLPGTASQTAIRRERLAWVARGVKESVGCDVVVLYEYRELQQRFELAGIHGELMSPHEFRGEAPSERSVVRVVVKDKKLRKVERIETDAQFRATRFASTERIKSCVALPLSFEGEIVGVMFVNFRRHRTFTEDEVQSIESFGSLAAVAIHNERQYVAAKRNQSTMSAMFGGTTAISQLGASANDEILQRVLEDSVKFDKADLATIQLYDPTTNSLNFAGVWAPKMLADIKTLPNVGDAKPLSRGITGRAARLRRPQLVPDVNAPGTDYVPFAPKIHSEMCVPLLGDQDELVGVLNVESMELNAFDNEDLDLLVALGRLATIAYKLRRHLTEKANFALWLMLVYHELDTPRQTITNTVQTLQGARELPEGPLEKVQTIGDAILQVNLFLEKIKDLGRILDGDIIELKKETAPISGVLQMVRRSFEWRAKERKIDLILEDGCAGVEVSMDVQKITSALSILVDNAIRATRFGHVRISAEDRGSEVLIEVRDTGSGVPTELQASIFKRLSYDKSRGSSDPQRGLGIGLSMCKEYVERHGGWVSYETAPGQGSVFSVTLPGSTKL
jgi:signal transduction histidine kinase